MLIRWTMGFALLGVAFAAVGMSWAAPGPTDAANNRPTEADIQKGLEKVNAELKNMNGQGAQVKYLADDVLVRALPGYLCYGVVFRQYPVVRLTPEMLKDGNVFIELKDHKLRIVSDIGGMEKFFQSALAPVKEEAAARDAVQAWLRLSEELHQDGFFQFSIPEKELTVVPQKEGLKASGKAVVEPRGGNKGAIAVTLTFDAAGNLVRAEETAKLQAGIRPICQATKLLDPDPIVRRMAEKDILVMGRLGKYYLDEQRARAGPELRNAIDRIWQRILDEGW